MPGRVGAKESSSRCWCCGQPAAESALLRLGEHPEVAVCFGCARFLHRRAREELDASRPSAAARGRSVVRSARRTVMRHGWQGRPIVGPALRWLDRFLP
jgi:hypothetical protein